MADRVAALHCPALITVRDQKTFGAQDELNAAILDFLQKGAIDRGMIAHADFLFAGGDAKIPHANDTIIIEGDTYTWKALAAADFEVTIGATALACAENLAEAIQTYGTENIVAVAGEGEDTAASITVYNADAPNGTATIGTADIELGGSQTHVENAWNHANLDETGRTELPYYGLIRVEATTENIASDFTIQTEFDIDVLMVFLPTKEDTITVITGVDFGQQTTTDEEITYAVACTAEVTSSENVVLFDLDHGSYPCEAGDIIYVIAAGGALHE